MRLADRRRALMMAQQSGRLPTGYTEVEYIQGTGTQYINTQYAGSYYRVQCKFAFAKPTANRQNVFGSITQYHGYRYLRFRADGGKHQITVGNNEDKNISNPLPTTEETTVDLMVNGTLLTISINDITNTFSFNGDNAFFHPLLLFAISDGDIFTVKYITSLCLYSFALFSDENTKVMDFVPCINPSNEVGLYDLVSKQFFGNSGTGVFIAGDPV